MIGFLPRLSRIGAYLFMQENNEANSDFFMFFGHENSDRRSPRMRFVLLVI